MTSIYQELIYRIHGEVIELERIIIRAEKAWLQATKALVNQDLYLDSVALNIHSFYSGLERIFELIAKYVDDSVPGAETWHRDLLYQMAREVRGVRPAVIEKGNSLVLDEFRRFRHLVRNVYATNLVPEKMAGLISALPDLWSKVRAELLAFADFLKALDQVSE